MAAQIGHEATAAILLKNGAPIAFDDASGCKVNTNCPLIANLTVHTLTCMFDCLHALKVSSNMS